MELNLNECVVLIGAMSTFKTELEHLYKTGRCTKEQYEITLETISSITKKAAIYVAKFD